MERRVAVGVTGVSCEEDVGDVMAELNSNVLLAGLVESSRPSSSPTSEDLTVAKIWLTCVSVACCRLLNHCRAFPKRRLRESYKQSCIR